MLHEVGKVLRSSFRESDVLGRVGGDEFLLLLKNIDLEVALDKLEPVSYTHLDVYKRQVLDVLVREFDVRPITTPEEDLKAILA